MSKYKVSTEELRTACDKLQQVLSGLQEASGRVNAAYYGMDNVSSAAVRNCRSAIIEQGRIYDGQWEIVQAVSAYVQEICSLSENAGKAAKEILDDEYVLTPDKMASGEWYACKMPEPTEDDAVGEAAVDLVQGVVGKLGVEGAVISSVWKTQEDRNGLNVLKQTNKIVNVVASEIVKDGTKAVAKQSKTFWKALGDELRDSVKGYGKKAFSNGVAKVAEGIRCITEWADVAIDGVLNLVDNADEFNGDMSNTRVYEETVVETALSWGVDTAVKAAAGAVVATTIGGPGIVVAGVAVGAGMLVNYGLDKASEWIFGNEEGWVENVSDTLIDTAHAVGDMMHDASEKVKNMLGNGISSVGKCLMTLWA